MTKNQIAKSSETESFVKNLQQVVVGFSDNMLAIRYLFTTLDPTLEEIKKREEIVEKIVQEKGKVLKDRLIVKKEKLTPEEEKIFKQLILQARGFSRRLPLLRQSSFLLLISYLECLLKDILKLHYYTYWKAMENKECKISVADINTAMNLEELKFFVVENYVDQIIYKNFNEQVKEVYSLLGIKNLSVVDIKMINEADKRRNLLIHNEGKVNQKYIRESGSKAKIGEKLEISEEYFEKVYYEIYLLGLILLSFLSVQLKDSEAYSWIVNKDIFSLLKRRRFDQVINFYDVCKDIQFVDSSDDIVVNIDYLLALKYSGKISQFNQKLSKIRTVHVVDKYKAAYAVLRDDKKEFLKYFSKTNITLKDWESWPLFYEFKTDSNLFNKIEKRLVRNQKKQDKLQNATK